MKRKQIRLTRKTSWGDAPGMLQTKQYANLPNPWRTDFGLCNEELSNYFDIALDCPVVYLILSTRECVDSYAVRQDGPEHIQVRDPDNLVWCDDDLAEMVGKYAKKAKQEYVYLSFEIPE